MSRREEVLKNFEKYKDETAERVKCGIEQNRKGYARFKIRDKDGNPVAGVKIRAKQNIPHEE